MAQNSFFLVFLGGGLGSVTRYAVSRYVQPWLGPSFPAGTLLVNVVASLVLGLVAGWMAGRQGGETVRLLVGVGFCGGLSTFSTFSTDTLALLQQGRILSAILNILLNVVLCLLVSWLGFAAGLHKLRSIL
ncbi:fluoride efflux transporter CrcB [Tellurirhabdus rosea]|uniref:fluoride efflux transporter CrcB n=1 Tax=Tellurirhabdus rosea TaxID=2674997 RepID=UPI0022575936|nr:fluoride efflux transporter CrcB [Tellurirhabdus rosea]